MNPRYLIVGGFVVTVGVIGWNEINTCHRLPFPTRIVFTGLTFALIDILSIVNAELGGVVGVGIVLAAIVNGGFVKNCDTCPGTIPPHCGSATLA